MFFRKRKGWWNSTEQEIKEEARVSVSSALTEIGEIFTKHRWMLDEKFLKSLVEEMRKQSEHSTNIQLELKSKGIKI